MTNKNNVKKMCLSAVFAAIICLVTATCAIPLPGNGFFNPGDAIIIVAALVLGPVWGGLAAAVGASLADVILAFFYYAPATFVIKFLMAVAAYFVYKALCRVSEKYKYGFAFVAGLTAEAVMVLGYFLYEICLYGMGTAVVDIAGNSLQGLLSLVVGPILFIIVDRIKYFKNL